MTFETRAGLFAWLEQHGLTHVARFNLEAVAPAIEPSLWKQLRAVGARRRLTDLGCDELIARSTQWLAPSPLRDVLPGVVAAFIENERIAAERARTEVAQRLVPSAATVVVFERLLELRTRVPESVAPRVDEALRVDDLTLDRGLPGFRFKDLLPTEQALRSGGGFGRAEVKLTLLPGALRFECTCGMSPCVHVLAAIDTALSWLRSAPAKDFEDLARPAWQRTLAKLDQALATSAPVTTGAQVQWRLQITDEIRVAAWIGERAVSRKELLHEFALPLIDSRLAPLLPDDDEPASRALLEGLIDHPRAVLERAPELCVRIERAQVGLVAEERLGSVRVSAGLEGAALPPYLADRVRRARPEEILFLWDEGPRRLTLLDVKPELRELLGVLQKENAVFPPESHAALLESLSKWAQRLPVAMPRSVLGESVPPTLLAVLRLEARPHGAVELEVRVRALPDAAAMLPGTGPRDVHLRRGEKAVHAVRDLKAEVAFAETLCNELPLSQAEVLGDFAFHHPKL